MKKSLILLIIPVLMLTACGKVNKSVASWNGYTEVTIDGVVYLQFPSGATVKYNRDGSIVTAD